ncbi:MAG: aminotransferase class I/II-fold pyridoxal phosphate-dependent enzyme, partial [Acidobacteria bacterium]|nr:aminotransferase class I/II-fold pyridoxal phosphate-dependent enzyme [Acidobacteriota bacterium]
MLSERVKRIAVSPTLKISAKAQELKKAGVDIIDFSVGEPDFPTPEDVKKAGIKAIEENFTKYVANDGIADLKKAIQEKLEKENNIKYKSDEIIVSPGAKSCLFNVALALFNEGDEIIIPTPCWVSYPDQVKLTGATPIFVEAKEARDFKASVED